MIIWRRIKEGDYLVKHKPEGFSYEDTYSHTNDINQATVCFINLKQRQSKTYEPVNVRVTRTVEIIE